LAGPGDSGGHLLGLDADDLNIALVGRVHPQKNHALLVAALRIIKERSLLPADRPVVCHCVGEVTVPALYEELQRQIVAADLTRNFRFHGVVQDIRPVYDATDLVVLPSLYEGCPNVVLEAMCRGRMVVASDVCDNARIIDDGVDGVLFASDDAEALARCLVLAAQMDPDRRREMTARARRKIVTDFSAARMVDGYEKLIRPAAERGGAP
jgi:glycosyltransferase involved in cell wall biosynthesis